MAIRDSRGLRLSKAAMRHVNRGLGPVSFPTVSFQLVYLTTGNRRGEQKKNKTMRQNLRRITGPVFRALFLLAACAAGLAGCSKNGDPADPPVVPPVILTDSVTAITDTSAVSGGRILSDGGSAILKRGVVWSTGPLPVLPGDAHSDDGRDTGTFVSQLSQLLPGLEYHVRAYAVTDRLTAYGAVVSFRTRNPVPDSVSDIDGNRYAIVPVGGREWLGRNLAVRRYGNGDPIPNIVSDDAWKTLPSGAWCAYDHQPAQAEHYGLLYNWFAVTDPRGLCPAGWHIPTRGEWDELAAFLGGAAVAGGKLKATGTLEQGNGLWYAPNEGATDSFGFAGLPGGYRINYGPFYSAGNVALLWSATDTASAGAWNVILDANNAALGRNFNLKTNGFSVRCVRD